MSGQDVNPFADPADVNPFAAKPAQQSNKEEYNPFADEPSVQKQNQPTMFAQPSNLYASQPATLNATRADDPPPVYGQQQFGTGAGGGYGTNTNASMRQRQEELERKAAELERKEQELKRQQNERAGIRENNFPPLPSFFCWKPCFYHDINVDIPVERQRTCKMLFYVWQLYIFTLAFNFICSLAFLWVDRSGATTFGLSILYMLLFAPCSFVCWYRPIYKALKSDSSFNYMVFFFVFFCQIVLCAVYSLGITGAVGWINGTTVVKKYKGVSVMMFICAVLWTVLALFMAFLLRKVHSAYRGSGASFEKAQGEFARGVASNKNVQNAAAEAVKSSVTANQQPQQSAY